MLYFSGLHIIIYQGGVKHCHIRIMLFNTHFAPTSGATQGVGQCIIRLCMAAQILPQLEGVGKKNKTVEQMSDRRANWQTGLYCPHGWLLSITTGTAQENYQVSAGCKRDGLIPRDEGGRAQPSVVFCWINFLLVSKLNHFSPEPRVCPSTRVGSFSQGTVTLAGSNKILNQLKPQCVTSTLYICLQSRPVTAKKNP